MQYPVPQFTEVEDKLIGALSLKQFGIIAIAGVLIFAGYSATKSVLVLVFLLMVFGLPAIGLAFVKINGRPIYLQFGHIFNFLFGPKQLVFHKQVLDFSSSVKLKDIELPKTVTEELSPKDTQSRIKEVQAILQRQQEEEAQLAGKIK
jgi:hypothetical protein